MMDDEEGVRENGGWDEQCSSISDFKQHLNEAALAGENLEKGWVLWNANEQQQLDVQLQHKIKTLLKHITHNPFLKILVQFWAVVKVEGSHHYLSTSHHSIYVSHLLKGNSWYRKKCMDHVYDVDMEGAEAEAEHLGGVVGRAYRNKRPESTPDLRLYSSNEFPLRDEAARCGFRAYLALPLFDIHTNQCYGVLEFLSDVSSFMVYSPFSALDQGLQIVGLRSTHMPISRYASKMTGIYKQQPDHEIKEILELAIKAVPQLSLAQVWVPCNHCANLCCMEQAAFITAHDKIVNKCFIPEQYILVYIQACDFHNLQSRDLSISMNPLAHYTQRARLSLPFDIHLESVDNSRNHRYVVIEYFLQCREDDDSSLNLLLRIMGMKLKSFKFVLEELEVRSRQYNAIECEAIEMLNNVMDSRMEIFSESEWKNFTWYLETVDFCCSEISSGGCRVFRPPVGDGLNEMMEKILHYMEQLAVADLIFKTHSMVQFWAPKKIGDRYCLQTSDQPYAVGCLAKGLASYRKKCMQHQYFVDDESKEEELGPPGRVFRNGHTYEAMGDLSVYSTKEFSLRNYALHCGIRDYFVLPVFDEHKHNCVGVLEFIGYSYLECIDLITSELHIEELCAIHIHCATSLLSDENPTNIDDGCKIKARAELDDAIRLFNEIPQVYKVEVWVSTDGNCTQSKSRYMRWDITTGGGVLEIDWINVEPRKGMTGMVLDSESKSCFCRDICEFSIAHEPLAPFHRRDRCSACFAICLQSSHTGDVPYVVQFFLNQDPATDDHLRSFLNSLLPVMKQELKSFKVATGKHLGEELVVELIQFSEANQLTSSNSDHLDHVFPISFKSVWYSQKEDQYIEDEQVQASPNPKKAEKGKRKTSLHLSLEDLEPHFGKKLKDVEQELGVGRSTIKRACREYGIDRWPVNEKQARNPSLCMRPSSSRSLPRRDALHANTKATEHPSVEEEAEKVMIKVKYEEDTTRFELCLSTGVMSRLFEEVERRIKLKMDGFKLKYLDEDGDEILIACDDDLKLCPKTQTAMGKTCIQLFVQLIAT